MSVQAEQLQLSTCPKNLTFTVVETIKALQSLISCGSEGFCFRQKFVVFLGTGDFVTLILYQVRFNFSLGE